MRYPRSGGSQRKRCAPTRTSTATSLELLSAIIVLPSSGDNERAARLAAVYLRAAWVGDRHGRSFAHADRISVLNSLTADSTWPCSAIHDMIIEMVLRCQEK